MDLPLGLDLGPVMDVVLFIILGLGALCIVGAVMFILYKLLTNIRRYDYTCIIFSKDGFGNVSQEIDQGGTFIDGKTNNKMFFLKENNVGLDTDKLPWIMNSKGKRYIYLLKLGQKNFRFINMNVNKYNEYSLTITEDNVNWAINAYEREKKRFNKSLWADIMPILTIAITGIIILLMIIMVLKKMDVIKDIAIVLENTAKILVGGNVIK